MRLESSVLSLVLACFSLLAMEKTSLYITGTIFRRKGKIGNAIRVWRVIGLKRLLKRVFWNIEGTVFAIRYKSPAEKWSQQKWDDKTGVTRYQKVDNNLSLMEKEKWKDRLFPRAPFRALEVFDRCFPFCRLE